MRTIWRSPSASSRTTGATWPGKTAGSGSNTTDLLCETRKKRANISRFLWREYKLHTCGLAFATRYFSKRPALSWVGLNGIHDRYQLSGFGRAFAAIRKIVRPSHQQGRF